MVVAHACVSAMRPGGWQQQGLMYPPSPQLRPALSPALGPFLLNPQPPTPCGPSSPAAGSTLAAAPSTRSAAAPPLAPPSTSPGPRPRGRPRPAPRAAGRASRWTTCSRPGATSWRRWGRWWCRWRGSGAPTSSWCRPGLTRQRGTPWVSSCPATARGPHRRPLWLLLRAATGTLLSVLGFALWPPVRV
jgi:hypothetical protein